ncbi:tRNA dihydrouridine(20/20a) synthase DusA [Methylocella sp.]|uniref:tRNA dihydrouridine(20/20a) synthase DusA n=1 Tax=Methylocella sp. TaxID=1978226 RepID=UPI003783E728
MSVNGRDPAAPQEVILTEKSSDFNAWRFCVAPMMEWTDRHCRSLHRLLSRRARLYTEMVAAGAVLHGPRARLIGFDPAERPLAVQLGGSEPEELAAAARACADFGYDEINLNVGCPSKRVKKGAFGACLMRAPDLVAEGVAAMKAAVALPVTVKCRIGVDEQDPEEALFGFAGRVVAAGADALIVHARKAWLDGLSPKDNRHIPPLDYDIVRRLKLAFADVPIVVNGGLTTIEATRERLKEVDGVMVGRAAYQDPALLLAVDPELFGEPASFADAFGAVEAYVPYLEARLAEDVPLAAMTRHMLGLYNGRPGARAFRRHLATQAQRRGAGVEVLREALAFVGAPDEAQAAE